MAPSPQETFAALAALDEEERRKQEALQAPQGNPKTV